MSRLRLTFFLLLLAGCAQSASEEMSVQVSFSPHPNSEMWVLQYDLPKEVDGLYFLRQRNQFRSTSWVGLDSGTQVIVRDGHEIIVSKQPAKRFRFLVRPFFQDTLKDYEFFVRFNDGAALVYTGHMIAIPLDCGGDCKANPKNFLVPTVSTTFHLQAARGEYVFVSDTSIQNSATVADDSFGRFIYFGKKLPDQRSGFRAIYDSGIPAWMLQEIDMMTSQLLAYYSSVIRFGLKKEPILFVSFDPHASRSYARGGVVSQQIQISLGGRELLKARTSSKQRIEALLSHELAHLWNGDLFLNSGFDQETWMHEGGAEAFSARALRDLKLITAEKFNDLHHQAIASCTSGLSGISLADSFSAGRYQNYYSCGMVIGQMTEVATRGRVSSLFEFWNLMFLRSLPSGRYSESTYLELLYEMSGQTNHAKIIDDFIHRPLADPNLSIQTILNSAL
jgi:hypothetical protein